MLFDSRNEQVEVKLNVDNHIQPAKATSAQKAMYIFFIIISLFIFLIFAYKKKNSFNTMQVEAQEASSQIQAAQAKKKSNID
ncbi:hypothetical protein [Mycoplasma sp. 3341]|uniref:hypothetical protein n=1 Tax=Mycoplasma sp. 3341 TaxID=3447506 RepID=UPI003F6553E8